MTVKPHFITEEQENFYNEHLTAAQSEGADSAALIYVLGIDEICRKHFPEIFDEKTRCIKPEALQASWQTGSSARTTRLAFHLYTWNIPEGDSPENYAPKELFAGLDSNHRRAAAQAIFDFA